MHRFDDVSVAAGDGEGRRTYVCGNVTCGKKGTKKQLPEKCSACLKFRYCDRQCAKVHWKHGGHKQECVARTTAGAASEGHAAIESLKVQVRKLQAELDQRASDGAKAVATADGAATGGGGGDAAGAALMRQTGRPCAACLVCDEGGTLPGKKGVCSNCATIFCGECWSTASLGVACPICHCAFHVCYDKHELEERLWIQSERADATNGAMISRRLYDVYNYGFVVSDEEDNGVEGEEAACAKASWRDASWRNCIGGIRPLSSSMKRLVRRAKMQELADAQFLLGMAYGEGRGVVKDPEQAMMLNRRAGWKAHAIALEKVIASAEEGGKDPEAVQSLLNAANKGVVTAQYLFGKCLADGRGTSACTLLTCASETMR